MSDINSKYELVLGMEIHMQLSTGRKMFCKCKSDSFDSEPNVNVCPVCLGLPGAMPVPNLDAIKKSQLMANALGSKLNSRVIFERKNYFYPDLPKGFQLTCPHYPISTGGEMDLSHLGLKGPFRWREIHLEEDTGKSMHTDKTYLDFNKSGIPLLEMVTEPDFRSIDDAVIFCTEIQSIAKTLKISDADMEKGKLRLEANISVRPVGQTNLPNYRVELKNINSFKFMKKALTFEFRRQIGELENGSTLYQETRGFNEDKNETFVQRSKEEANDYRYFPEPDIPPIEFTDPELDSISNIELSLPKDKFKLLNDLGVPTNYINILIGDETLYKNVISLINEYKYEPKKAVSIYIDKPSNRNLTPAEIVNAEKKNTDNKITDANKIKEIIATVLAENPKAIQDYKDGKENSIQFLIGQVMRSSKGMVDVTTAKEILLTKLQNSI